MIRGCGAKTVKWLVFTFNLLSFLVGAAIVVVCILGVVKSPVQEKLLDKLKDLKVVETYNYVLYAGIALGALIMILGFLGCCGAVIESKCLLCTFALLLALLTAAQVAVGIIILVKKDLLIDPLNKGLDELQTEALSNDQNACQLYKDLNDDDKCCFNNGQAPRSPDACKGEIVCKTSVQGKGCKAYFEDTLTTFSKVSGAVIIAVLVVEVLAIIFAMCLCCSIRSGGYE